MNQFYQQSLLGLFIVEDIKKRATSTPSDVNELLKSIVLVTSAKATLFSSPSPPTHPNTVCVLLKYYACKIEHLRCGKSFNLFLSHLHTFFPLFIFQVSSIQINRSMLPYWSLMCLLMVVKCTGRDEEESLIVANSLNYHLCLAKTHKSNSVHYY